MINNFQEKVSTVLTRRIVICANQTNKTKRVIAWLMFFSIISFFIIGKKSDAMNFGKTFDSLMNKKASGKYYKKCVRQKKNKGAWFRNSKLAYKFARAQHEKCSIETHGNINSLKIPKIIHQIWLGGALPEIYAKWTESWEKYHPEWTYILWGDDDLQYLNLVYRDLLNAATNYGEKSDILRLELINLFGGLYVDTDGECCRPFDRFHYANTFYVSALAIGECGLGIANGIFAASPGHPLIKKLVEGLREASKLPTLCERTGPIYFTRIFFQHAPHYSENVAVYPPRYFIPSQDPKDECRNIPTYAYHWFAASWGKSFDGERRIVVDRRMENCFTSLFFRKKRKDVRQEFNIKNPLPELINSLHIESVKELGGCDFIVKADALIGTKYIAITPVKFLALEKRLEFPQENMSYLWKDWSKDINLDCDLLIIGNVLQYLPYDDCALLLKKVLQSKAKYVMIEHDAVDNNHESNLGIQRKLNMYIAPFNFTQPEISAQIGSKVYGVWRI